MNIKKKNFIFCLIGMFVFATLLSCGIFALVAKSVSFNMVMHLNPTVYFGLELQVDSNGDGDFSDSFTSNNVAFNESTVYTIFDNRITNFVDHEPWAIVNLNKIVLQNTDALNNPFGDLGVNACFKIKVWNYTSSTDLGVDENSAEMQALWLMLNPTEFSSMYAVPEYGVQNVAYGSYKEFMIYPQSITTDYFEIPFTVELKTKTIDHAINAITTENDPSGSGETVTITLDSPQNTITNGHDFIASFNTKFDTVKIASVTLGGNEIAYTYTNQTKQIKIAGGNIFDLNSANSLQIHIEKVGYMLVEGITIDRLLNGGVGGLDNSNQNQVLKSVTVGWFDPYKTIVQSFIQINVGLDGNANKIILYNDVTLPTVAYILSDYYIFGNYSCEYMFRGFGVMEECNLENINTHYTTSFFQMFANNHGSSCVINGLTNIDTSNATSLSYMFWQNRGLTSLNLSSFNTQNVTSMNHIFCVCERLSEIIGLETLNTAKVKYFGSMFYNAYKLVSLNLSQWNTSSATNMSLMFWCSSPGYTSLQSVNLANFNTSNVTSMNQMFYNCSNLTTLDISSFNTEKVTDMSEMFYGCSALTTIKVGTKFLTTNVTTSADMFAGCSNLVGKHSALDTTTAWSSTLSTDKTYALIHGTDGKPGLLSNFI